MDSSQDVKYTHGMYSCVAIVRFHIGEMTMTETSIDEILSLLRDQKRDIEQCKNTLALRLEFLKGELNEIDYLIEYIEVGDHD